MPVAKRCEKVLASGPRTGSSRGGGRVVSGGLAAAGERMERVVSSRFSRGPAGGGFWENREEVVERSRGACGARHSCWTCGRGARMHEAVRMGKFEGRTRIDVRSMRKRVGIISSDNSVSVVISCTETELELSKGSGNLGLVALRQSLLETLALGCRGLPRLKKPLWPPRCTHTCTGMSYFTSQVAKTSAFFSLFGTPYNLGRW